LFIRLLFATLLSIVAFAAARRFNPACLSAKRKTDVFRSRDRDSNPTSQLEPSEGTTPVLAFRIIDRSSTALLFIPSYFQCVRDTPLSRRRESLVLIRMMGRLQKRSRSPSLKQASPYPASALLSHFEPPSPEDRRPSLSSIPSPLAGYLPFIGIWPTRSSQSIGQQVLPPVRPKHIPIDVTRYTTTALSTILEINFEEPGTFASPRNQRHIPIVIPDFANPFQVDSPTLVHHGSQDTLVPKSLRREIRIIPTLEAAAIPSSAVKTPKEVYPSNWTDELTLGMNRSQTSLSAPDNGLENGHQVPQSAASATNLAGISPLVTQQTQSGATNLSGLVCNVHRTTGREPHALVGATTTILGDKLYVFGGRIHSRSRPQLTSDLYELDLIRRHWSKVDTTGDVPPPRYFHSVCTLGDTKLVCYGGMSPSTHVRNQPNGQTQPQSAKDPQPEVGVMSDIHVLDVPSRTWTRLSTSDNPQGRYAHCATIIPSSAVFTSATAPLSAIHHNPSSSNPNSGTLGVQLDGTGGAEMIVVGGQDSANNYIEQISVFNLRSLKWTTTTPWDRKCGAYKSMVAPLPTTVERSLGRGAAASNDETLEKKPTSSMLIYSNYNFLEVKLELQIRSSDGTLREIPMAGNISPPGLRFPNGGITDNHFVVSGTYLTSAKHEYALWALDLRTLTWGRIDTNGTVFGQGSWNRGVLWNRRNTFVILGHRKRSLVDDYNHRRINFSHICMVELEAFGLYDNPRRNSPNSAYVSISSPPVPVSLQSILPSHNAGGRPFSAAAAKLGQAVLGTNEAADMELIADKGERISCNSHVLSQRWGPYFDQLLLETVSTLDGGSISDAATLRPNMHSQASRNSSITITPSLQSNNTTLAASEGRYPESVRTASRATTRTLATPGLTMAPAASRARSLYLPHTAETIQLMLYFLYTSSLPSIGSPLCAPAVLCSLLQLARPYQIDGLLEATVERLHEVLDGRNAAAVFNAAAMAAGGGRGLGQASGGTLETLERRESESKSTDEDEPNNIVRTMSAKAAGLRIDTSLVSKVNGTARRGHRKADSGDSASTATSASTDTDVSMTDPESSTQSGSGEPSSKQEKEEKEVWTGDVSTVIGLQKRGLRG
jgi:hypothetical protein